MRTLFFLSEILLKTVAVTKPVRKARMYITGHGLYELCLNGEKQGDECLLPGFCDYDTWIQYQTYVVELKQGENEIEVLLGYGWYKGWYGLKKILEENYLAGRKQLPFQKELYTLDEFLNGPFTSMPHEKQKEIDKKLRETV